MAGEGLLYNFISFVFTTLIDNVSRDLDLQVGGRGGGGGNLDPEIMVALRASFWSKNKGGRATRLVPPLRSHKSLPELSLAPCGR